MEEAWEFAVVSDEVELAADVKKYSFFSKVFQSLETNNNKIAIILSISALLISLYSAYLNGASNHREAMKFDELNIVQWMSERSGNSVKLSNFRSDQNVFGISYIDESSIQWDPIEINEPEIYLEDDDRMIRSLSDEIHWALKNSGFSNPEIHNTAYMQEGTTVFELPFSLKTEFSSFGESKIDYGVFAFVFFAEVGGAVENDNRVYEVYDVNFSGIKRIGTLGKKYRSSNAASRYILSLRNELLLANLPIDRSRRQASESPEVRIIYSSEEVDK